MKGGGQGPPLGCRGSGGGTGLTQAGAWLRVDQPHQGLPRAPSLRASLSGLPVLQLCALLAQALSKEAPPAAHPRMGWVPHSMIPWPPDVSI